jgi:hypothetical protein
MPLQTQTYMEADPGPERGHSTRDANDCQFA